METGAGPKAGEEGPEAGESEEEGVGGVSGHEELLTAAAAPGLHGRRGQAFKRKGTGEGTDWAKARGSSVREAVPESGPVAWPPGKGAQALAIGEDFDQPLLYLEWAGGGKLDGRRLDLLPSGTTQRGE
jgi:hypothetical protein